MFLIWMNNLPGVGVRVRMTVYAMICIPTPSLSRYSLFYWIGDEILLYILYLEFLISNLREDETLSKVRNNSREQLGIIFLKSPHTLKLI